MSKKYSQEVNDLMASRLYPTTRSVYRQVANVLWALGVATLGSPIPLDLISLYVTGLILLDERQNCSRITRFLPGRTRVAESLAAGDPPLHPNGHGALDHPCPELRH